MSIPVLFLTASVSMTSAPGAIIDKLFDSFNRHDVAALQALYAPNARLTSSDFCKPRTGADVAPRPMLLRRGLRAGATAQVSARSRGAVSA
jgi:hypothetical protein